MKRLKFFTWLLAFVMTCGGLWGQVATQRTAPRGNTYTSNNKRQQVAPAQAPKQVAPAQTSKQVMPAQTSKQVTPAQTSKQVTKQQQTQEPKKQITFKVRPWTYANLTRHWEKHGAEFPEYKSEKEYGDGALEFFSHPPEGTLFKTNEYKDRLYYYPKTNTFGVTTSTGVPKTLFRPDAGIRYWNRQ